MNISQKEQETASCNYIGNTRPSAGIDWLEVVFPKLLDTHDFISSLENHGEGFEVWNGKPGWYLSSSRGFRDLRLKIPSRTQFNIALGLVLNPNKYPCYQYLCSVVDKFIPIEFIKVSDIRRIDFNIDLPESLSKIQGNLDIKHKRCTRIFKSGIPTGIEFGKGEEKIVVYDRGNKIGECSNLLTRIEIRLSGRKLPFKKFHQIESIPDILNSGDLNPFENVRIFDVQIKRPTSFKNEVQAERYGEFRSFVNIYGYAQAKRILNRNRNFHRHYGDLFEFNPSRWNLHQILTEELNRYFDVHGGGHE